MHAQIQAGQRIGDWVVVEPLGSGGMGSVFRCHSALSDQVHAAVKVLAATTDPEAKARFVRELEVLARLDHPSIVRVRGGGEDAATGALYIAMELVDGRDLSWFIEGRRIPWQDACRIVRDAARGLAEAHRVGVHHRDLKPANVMLGEGGRVKLIDFGIALESGATRLTQARGIPGTMSYMPPEVFARGAHDASLGDIYSLGVVLYEALVGERAYPEEPTLTTVQRFAAIMGAKGRDPHLDPGSEFPPALRELVKAATSREPERRIPDAGAFADALEPLVQATAPTAWATAPDAPRATSEDTFTLDAATRDALAVATVPAEVPAPAPARRPSFPWFSLLISALMGIAPEAWVVFWFLVALPARDLGATMVALALIAAPLLLPPWALVGVAVTVGFATRVTTRSRTPVFWWGVALALLGLHLWHLFLAIADAAWLVTMAHQMQRYRAFTWLP